MLYSMRKSRRKEGYTSVSFQAFSVIMQCKFQSMYHLYGTCLSLQYTYCAISKIVKEFWEKFKKISKSCYSVIFMGKILRLHLRDSI